MSDTKPDPIMQVEHVSHGYHGQASTLAVLDDISFEVAQQEFICIVGPSGCGKSTLLRLMAGLIQPTQGQVRLDGQPLAGPHRHIGVVFQKANLMPWRTARDNVVLPLELAGLGRSISQQCADELLRLVGLEGFESTYPHDLSGGMEQRVAIARALAHDPRLLLLDEPFGALDAMTRERMGLELLRIWEASHKTVVMVTHDISEAVFLADHVVALGPRPGTLRAIFNVPLQRPRGLEQRYGMLFGEIAGQVRAAIG
ncbi:MAG: ABC transporter ATP-binding protein [Thermoflexales bacterium]|nr:ABC transporter ATP-binding protein [Thermoflexales bacterium]